MKTSHYKSNTMEQVLVSIEGYETEALLTRFVGERTWEVRGKNFARFDITMRDGNKTQFLRSTALHLAEQFIRTGRDFL